MQIPLLPNRSCAVAVVVAAAWLALAGAVCADTTAHRAEVPVEQFTLDNGMTFLLVQRPQMTTVPAGSVAQVGPANARPGITGPSQLVLDRWEAERLLHGSHEDVYRAEILPVQLAIDEWYVRQGSVFTDVQVVWSMVERFLMHRSDRWLARTVVAAVPDGAAQVLRGVPEDQLARMRGQQSRFGPGTLSRAADIVNAGITEMTGATSPRLQLELICARILLPGASGESGYAARLDRIERHLDAGGGVPQWPLVSETAGHGRARGGATRVAGGPGRLRVASRGLRHRGLPPNGQRGAAPTSLPATHPHRIPGRGPRSSGRAARRTSASTPEQRLGRCPHPAACNLRYRSIRRARATICGTGVRSGGGLAGGKLTLQPAGLAFGR